MFWIKSILQLLSKADRHLGSVDMYSHWRKTIIYQNAHCQRSYAPPKIVAHTNQYGRGFFEKEEINLEKRMIGKRFKITFRQ